MHSLDQKLHPTDLLNLLVSRARAHDGAGNAFATAYPNSDAEAAGEAMVAFAEDVVKVVNSVQEWFMEETGSVMGSPAAKVRA